MHTKCTTQETLQRQLHLLKYVTGDVTHVADDIPTNFTDCPHSAHVEYSATIYGLNGGIYEFIISSTMYMNPMTINKLN